MAEIRYNDLQYTMSNTDTVLDCLLRNGIDAPNSCRTGICQCCLMRAVDGTPPPASQNGLKDTLRAQGYFLPCVCRPETDLAIVSADACVRTSVRAQVLSKVSLNADIVRVRLRPDGDFPYRAGQFLHLRRPDGLTRSYSLASLPGDPHLDLHIRCLPGGRMSDWVRSSLAPGDWVDITGPTGDCFYVEGEPQRPLLLIGTGSGLAPLFGIVRDALEHGHTGPISLFHGSWEPSGLYLETEMDGLSAQYPNLTYTACVDRGALERHTIGRADVTALQRHRDLKSWRIYLCGHPEMVKFAKRGAFLQGASIRDIYADPFVLGPAA